MPERKVVCHGCGRAHSFEDVVPRRAACEGCACELHSCANCRFYDESAYNQCSEPSAERVVEKDRANFCDYFAPASAAAAVGESGGDAKTELEKLFGKKGP